MSKGRRTRPIDPRRCLTNQRSSSLTQLLDTGIGFISMINLDEDDRRILFVFLECSTLGRRWNLWRLESNLPTHIVPPKRPFLPLQWSPWQRSHSVPVLPLGRFSEQPTLSLAWSRLGPCKRKFAKQGFSYKFCRLWVCFLWSSALIEDIRLSRV